MDKHNTSYGVFFSHVPMLCELLRTMIGEPGVELIDFVSAQRVHTSCVFDKRRQRESDIIWKLRRRDTGDWIYAFVLLQLPPRADRYVPIRRITHKDSTNEILMVQGWLSVEPEEPWRKPSEEPTYGVKGLGEKESSMAALFRLHSKRAWEAARVGVARVHENADREGPGLRDAFENLLEEVIIPLMGTDAYQNPEDPNLEEYDSIVAEQIASFAERRRQERRQQGRQEGQAKALLLLLETRFGPVDQATRDRIATADVNHLESWIKRLATAESTGDVFSD